jgi:hypothetical protein
LIEDRAGENQNKLIGSPGYFICLPPLPVNKVDKVNKVNKVNKVKKSRKPLVLSGSRDFF